MIMPTAEDVKQRYLVCTGPPACENLYWERGECVCNVAEGCSGAPVFIRWQLPLERFACPVGAWET